ncbi:MAG: transglutaminase-like cysteine peptidase [Thermodesulfobacteriota bacterium]
MSCRRRRPLTVLFLLLLFLARGDGRCQLQALLRGGDLLRISERYGAAASGRIAAWLQLIMDGWTGTTTEKLEMVNQFFNRIPNLADRQLWQRADYWATPFELLLVNGGDCEDFVIAKYFSLRELGVAEERLRIVYAKVFDRDGSVASHMVLAYHPGDGSEPLILDNIDTELRPASERGDLVPVYSFQGYDLISSRQEEAKPTAAGHAPVPRWDELLERITVREKGAPPGAAAMERDEQ